MGVQIGKLFLKQPDLLLFNYSQSDDSYIVTMKVIICIFKLWI